MNENEELVKAEVLDALHTYTDEGFAEYVGFAIADDRLHAIAEVYDGVGSITGRYHVDISVTPILED